ncbi:MAG: hypothetical protein IJI14_12075 [Anaerolineaceae bacterium]|nr:hypothetical protein [Anaerolineaceae bacterium]
MIKAMWNGNKVRAVTAYENAADHHVWITIRRCGCMVSMCVPMSTITLEEEQ